MAALRRERAILLELLAGEGALHLLSNEGFLPVGNDRRPSVEPKWTSLRSFRWVAGEGRWLCAPPDIPGADFPSGILCTVLRKPTNRGKHFRKDAFCAYSVLTCKLRNANAVLLCSQRRASEYFVHLGSNQIVEHIHVNSFESRPSNQAPRVSQSMKFAALARSRRPMQ